MHYFIPYQMAAHHEAELAAAGFSIKRYVPVSVEDVTRVVASLEELRVLCPNGAGVLFGRPFMEYGIGDLQTVDTLVLVHGNSFAIVQHEAKTTPTSEAPTPPMDGMVKSSVIEQAGVIKDSTQPVETPANSISEKTLSGTNESAKGARRKAKQVADNTMKSSLKREKAKTRRPYRYIIYALEPIPLGNSVVLPF